jgi:hypothetical protein
MLLTWCEKLKMRFSRAVISILLLVCVTPAAWGAEEGRYEAFVIGRKGAEPQYHAIAWRLDRYTGELKQCFMKKDFSYECIERISSEHAMSNGHSLRFDLDKWWNNSNKGLGYLGAARIDTKTGEILFCGEQVPTIQQRGCQKIAP